jgi:hypothetical protein
MNTLRTLIAATTLAGLSGAALAASDGTLGATSTGTSDVSLTINDRVQISSVADIALGAYGGSGSLTGSSAFCVYRNGGDDYTLTLTADTGSFAVDSVTTGDSIAFAAKVDDDTDASDGLAAVYNTASANLTGSASTNCGGSDNASLYVSFAEADLQAVSSANDYQATVTLLVTPI